MANRFPLVLDTESGNRIKELPSGDNLNLRECSIIDVQNVNSLGVINAADIRINGERLKAQKFTDLVDTPTAYAEHENYIVKINSTLDGLEFRSIHDFGRLELDVLQIKDSILPDNDLCDIGTDQSKFARITSRQFKGDLIDENNNVVFNSADGHLYYHALQGAPKFLSEFSDDIGFLKTKSLSNELSNIPAATMDITGNVYSSDSSIIVDSIDSSVIANSITINPQSEEPSDLKAGTLVAADGVNWDPLQKEQSTAYLIFFDGENWQPLY